MQALNVLMNEKVDVNNVIDFDAQVKPSVYQIYNASSLYDLLKEVLITSDLVLWDQDVKPEKAWNVYNAQSLWDKITSIKECHCDPNLMDFLRELKQISTIDPPTAIGNLKSFVLRGNIKAMGAFMSSNLPMKSDFTKRPDLTTEVNEEENDYNAVNDYEPFDPENPVYGTYYLPCCLDITGTINGIHTKDILTKDDIDDLGASHFMTVEGAPPFTISNDCLTFESVLDGSIADRITFTFNEDVMTYLKTLSTETNVIEIRFRKLQVYDIDGNLVSNTYIKYNSSTWTVFNLAKNEQGVLQLHYETTETPQLTAYESAELLLKDIYSEGVMMFSYALSETCIQSDRDVVKCNIIEAKNAFKLIETDQLYLYEPTVIDEKTIEITGISCITSTLQQTSLIIRSSS